MAAKRPEKASRQLLRAWRYFERKRGHGIGGIGALNGARASGDAYDLYEFAWGEYPASLPELYRSTVAARFRLALSIAMSDEAAE